MKSIAISALTALLLGCAPGTTSGGGFYYTNSPDGAVAGQDASQNAGNTDTQTSAAGVLSFGQLEGKWDVLFANWFISSGTAKFAGNKADLALVGTNQGKTLYGWEFQNCVVAEHSYAVHLEIATDALILCSLTEKVAYSGYCPGMEPGSVTVNFTFKKDSPGTSQFGTPSGGWHIEWPVSTDTKSVKCSFSLASGAIQGCGNAEFQFSSALVGTIMNGKIDSKGTFSAQRQ